MKCYDSIHAANAALDVLALGEVVEIMGVRHRVIRGPFGDKVFYRHVPDNPTQRFAERFVRSGGRKGRSTKTWHRV